MKNEKIDKKDSDDFETPETNDEIFKFGYLVNVILDYYMSEKEETEKSESWKKGTEHETHSIPQDIDKLIHEGFKQQLSKFINKD